MTYTIYNNFGKITIRLTSSITSSLQLTYTRNGVIQPVKNSTINNGVHTWTINLKQYSIGDVLDDFTVSASNKYLWQTDEGVTILLNGGEVDNVHTNTWTHKFDKAGSYTIEAVYQGNDSIAMSTTDRVAFEVTQPTVENPSSNPSTGKYKLEFVDKNTKTYTYNDDKKIEFRLTQGDKPVKGKTVEKVTPKSILSSDTNKNGISFFTNTGYGAGSYKIGAYFYDYQDKSDKKIVDSVYKDITIKKADPKITYTKDRVKKGEKVGIFIRDNKGNRIANEKIPVYINGKLKSKTTNANGNIWFKMTNTGTFKFKVAYKGNKNLNKKTVTFSKTIKK